MSTTDPNGIPVNTNPNNGSGAGVVPFNLPIWMAIAGFTAVAWYNVVELNVNIYMTFKKRRGLYFWALLISSWGVIGHSLSLIFKFFTNENVWWVCTMLMFGWWAMVTGQSVVLYSRLHLVVRDHRILRSVLIMIIVDGICLHIPTSIMTYGSSSDAYYLFIVPFSYMEKVQMTIFTIQEAIISGIYVYYTLKLIKPALNGNRRRTRSVMLQLIWINIFIVAMDLAVLAMEYHGDYYIEAGLKSMVYSIKLKLEFAVLNQLMRLAQSSVSDARMAYGSSATARARSGVADDMPASARQKGRGGIFSRIYSHAEGGPRPDAEAEKDGITASVHPVKGSSAQIQVSKEIDIQFSDRATTNEGSETRSDTELRSMSH